MLHLEISCFVGRKTILTALPTISRIPILKSNMSVSCFFQDDARGYDAKADSGKVKRSSGRPTKDKRILPGRINLSYRIIIAIYIRTDRVVLLRHRINSRPCSRAVVEAGAEVGVGDAEGGILLLLAAEAPAVRSELGQAVGMALAEGVVVVLLDHCSARIDDGPHAAQMVGDVVVHRIGVAPRPADTPAAEGDALEGAGIIVSAGVGE